MEKESEEDKEMQENFQSLVSVNIVLRGQLINFEKSR